MSGGPGDSSMGGASAPASAPATAPPTVADVDARINAAVAQATEAMRTEFAALARSHAAEANVWSTHLEARVQATFNSLALGGDGNRTLHFFDNSAPTEFGVKGLKTMMGRSTSYA